MIPTIKQVCNAYQFYAVAERMKPGDRENTPSPTPFPASRPFAGRSGSRSTRR